MPRDPKFWPPDPKFCREFGIKLILFLDNWVEITIARSCTIYRQKPNNAVLYLWTAGTPFAHSSTSSAPRTVASLGSHAASIARTALGRSSARHPNGRATSRAHFQYLWFQVAPDDTPGWPTGRTFLQTRNHHWACHEASHFIRVKHSKCSDCIHALAEDCYIGEPWRHFIL